MFEGRIAMKNSLMIGLFVAATAMAEPREVAIRLGADGPALVEGLSMTSSTEGSDSLECLREGEWSVGHVTLKATRAAPEGEPSLTLRILGGAERAPVPALVRRGPVKLGDGQTPVTLGTPPVRETYIRNARRDGTDVVATIPFPLVPGLEDRYDLVDQSVSVDWRQEPALEADSRDGEPQGRRRALVLIPGDEEGDDGHGPRDARLAAFQVLRDAPAYKKLLATHKPYIFRYAAYRDPDGIAAALTQLVRTKLPAGKVALIAHGSGADLMRRALAAPALARRVSSAITLAENTPATLFSALSGN